MNTDTPATTQLYDQAEWSVRQAFVQLIERACKELGIQCTWLSDYWIAELVKGEKRAYMYGYNFSLNNTAVSRILDDKAATSEVLLRQGVSAIHHHIIRPMPSRATSDVANDVLAIVQFPLVLKPSNSTGGDDVLRCEDHTELIAAVDSLRTRFPELAVSDFHVIAHEYRVIILDGQPQLCFEKIRTQGWRHNLGQGAQPAIISDVALQAKLTDLAASAMKAAQARLGAVDIVEIDGTYLVLEINSGIMLSHFSRHDQKHAEISERIYNAILRSCLDL